jgi:hypothetical protein
MNLLKWFEKLITEHASAAIMEKRLVLKDDENLQLKAKISDLEAKIKTFEVSQQKQNVEAEEIRLHKGIEFRRGSKTSGKWAAFCPKCQLPAQQVYRTVFDKTNRVVTCSASCGWKIYMQENLDSLISELPV